MGKIILNLGSKKIKTRDLLKIPTDTSYKSNLISVEKNDVEINANEDGGIDCYTGLQKPFDFNVYTNACIAIRNGKNVTINGGTYVGGAVAIYVVEGKLEIKGGTFFALFDDSSESYKTPFTINCKDANYSSNPKKAVVSIKGGRFIGFDPASNAAEGQNTNFVADGFESTPINKKFVFKPNKHDLKKLKKHEGTGYIDWVFKEDGTVELPIYEVREKQK